MSLVHGSVISPYFIANLESFGWRVVDSGYTHRHRAVQPVWCLLEGVQEHIISDSSVSLVPGNATGPYCLEALSVYGG